MEKDCRSEFEKELAHLINRYSKENESDTPDFILAQYIVGCLAAFSAATRKRDGWNKTAEVVFEKPSRTFLEVKMNVAMDDNIGKAIYALDDFEKARVKPWFLRRWWLKTRPCKNAMQIDGQGLPAVREFYVPWWAWPLELLHRFLFGKTKLKAQ